MNTIELRVREMSEITDLREIKRQIVEYENDAKTLRKHGDMVGARMCLKEIRKLKRKLRRLERDE